MTRCTHADRVQILECGAIGCYDDSPNAHATSHAKETGHVLIRSRLTDLDEPCAGLDAIEGLGSSPILCPNRPQSPPIRSVWTVADR